MLHRASAALCLWLSTLAAASAEDNGRGLTFEHDIRPILRAHCLDCHGAEDTLQGGLDLRQARLAMKGGESGSALVAGDPAASHLLARVRSGEMPPGELKVTPAELATLTEWVRQGAKTVRPEPETLPPGLGITPEERSWWAFQPLRRPETPQVQAQQQVRTPIDAFLLQKLEQNGLTFSPEADKATLVRRAYLDLLGLPPTVEEVDQFVQDDSAGAWERLIERLLESPRYGERWGRQWLDVAGYADSDGYTNDDPVRPYAYKYRDYVIRSLNADKPFDRFLVEQLAGDELVAPPYQNLTPEQQELLIATGYLRMAVDGTSSGGVDQDVARNQVVSDTLKIVSTSLLGLSVGCAQCHDHRYDPVPQADYYALRAIFEPAYDWKNWRNPGQRLVSLYTDADRARAAEVEAEVQKIAAEKNVKQTEAMAAALEKELEKHPEELRESLKTAYQTPADKRTEEQQKLLKERPSVNITPGVLYQYDQKAADELKKFDERIAETRAKKPVEDFLSPLTEVPGTIPATLLFHRGDYRQPKSEIAPADLSVSSPDGERFSIASDDPQLPTSGRRLAYAKWLTNGRHPLVTRVLVNRFWLGHFGNGIVATPSDFGRLGERPSHPELLDWLADEFVAQGWSLKSFHRLVMTSTAYRQSSRRNLVAEQLDADNRWLWRMPVHRLEAEVLRDSVLAAAGVLDQTMFGPAAPVSADDAGQVLVTNETPRRSIYIQTRRSQPVAFLTAFDAPVMEVNCERRTSSTVAGQSLMLMNSEFALKHARLVAERARREAAAELSPGLAAVAAKYSLQQTSQWSYGSGEFDANTGRTSSFAELPHWTGSGWQGGAQLPDAKLGWALLHATGGHTGETGFSPIRRWTAPRGGVVQVRGVLKHGSPNGDGVHGVITSSRAGSLGGWDAHNGEAPTNVQIEVAKGDTIDFVTECRANVTSDSFEWIASVTYDGAASDVRGAWDSRGDFHGPNPPAIGPQIARAWRVLLQREIAPEELELALQFAGRQLETLDGRPSDAGFPDSQLQVLTNLCQALLGSNEFLYAD